MKIAVIKETRQFEERVSCTPEIAKKLIGIGFKVSIESNAGSTSSYADEDYKKVGVEIVKTQKSLLSSAEIVFAVIRPELKIPSVGVHIIRPVSDTTIPSGASVNVKSKESLSGSSTST